MSGNRLSLFLILGTVFFATACGGGSSGPESPAGSVSSAEAIPVPCPAGTNCGQQMPVGGRRPADDGRIVRTN
jgi:hypothetical protein